MITGTSKSSRPCSPCVSDAFRTDEENEALMSENNRDIRPSSPSSDEPSSGHDDFDFDGWEGGF